MTCVSDGQTARMGIKGGGRVFVRENLRFSVRKEVPTSRNAEKNRRTVGACRKAVSISGKQIKYQLCYVPYFSNVTRYFFFTQRFQIGNLSVGNEL